jgi:hypothetical protein
MRLCCLSHLRDGCRDFQTALTIWATAVPKRVDVGTDYRILLYINYILVGPRVGWARVVGGRVDCDRGEDDFHRHGD